MYQGTRRNQSLALLSMEASMWNILWWPFKHDKVLNQRLCLFANHYILYFSSFTSICNSLGYDRPFTSLHTCACLASMPFPFPFLLVLADVIASTATFGLSTPDFIQADLRLPDHFFAPISVLSLQLLLPPLAPPLLILFASTSTLNLLSSAFSSQLSHSFASFVAELFFHITDIYRDKSKLIYENSWDSGTSGVLKQYAIWTVCVRQSTTEMCAHCLDQPSVTMTKAQMQVDIVKERKDRLEVGLG